jgi:hypothetical protein
VVHRQDNRAFLNDSLGMNDPKSKEDLRDQPGDMIN